jgi:hypothetical protein
MQAIYILWLRELKRYARSRAQIVASLGQPLLYLLVLGFGLGPVFQKSGGGVFGFGDNDRVEHAGHAGISFDHELSGAADFPLSGALFPEEFAQGAWPYNRI